MPQKVFLFETPQYGVTRRGVHPQEAAQLSLGEVMPGKIAIFPMDNVHATIHVATNSRHTSSVSNGCA